MRANEMADREHHANRRAHFFLWTGDGFERDALCAFPPECTKTVHNNPLLERLSQASSWSIPRFRAEFLCFTSKSVEVWPNLSSESALKLGQLRGCHCGLPNTLQPDQPPLGTVCQLCATKATPVTNTSSRPSAFVPTAGPNCRGPPREAQPDQSPPGLVCQMCHKASLSPRAN